jgi:hypothetical protein
MVATLGVQGETIPTFSSLLLFLLKPFDVRQKIENQTSHDYPTPNFPQLFKSF